MRWTRTLRRLSVTAIAIVSLCATGSAQTTNPRESADRPTEHPPAHVFESSEIRGWIGFRFCDYRPPPEGEDGWIEVQEVAPGSPADKAGLEAGDLIARIDDEPVRFEKAAEVARFLRGRRAGTTIVFDVRRGTERKTIRIRVGAPPSRTPPSGR